jgi:transposase-like protein
MGLALHPNAGGGCEVLLSRCRRPLVRRRDHVKVSGSWRYLYRAVDQKRPGHRRASKRPGPQGRYYLFAAAINSHGEPTEITTDRDHVLVRVVVELLPATLRDTTQYTNNRSKPTTDA